MSNDKTERMIVAYDRLRLATKMVEKSRGDLLETGFQGADFLEARKHYLEWQRIQSEAYVDYLQSLGEEA